MNKNADKVADLILERLAATIDYHIICGQPPFNMRYIRSLQNEVKGFISEKIQDLLDSDQSLKRELVAALKDLHYQLVKFNHSPCETCDLITRAEKNLI